ncbi:hypothetical protein CW304_01655 [Bacillus sp. UFRGS-B20]|nr:hypothetical protein CW304_01655 [Bacillus sp. UFRGS-B20]
MKKAQHVCSCYGDSGNRAYVLVTSGQANQILATGLVTANAESDPSCCFRRSAVPVQIDKRTHQLMDKAALI